MLTHCNESGQVRSGQVKSVDHLVIKRGLLALWIASNGYEVDTVSVALAVR